MTSPLIPGTPLVRLQGSIQQAYKRLCDCLEVQGSSNADARNPDNSTSVATARSRDLQLEAEEVDAPFIAEELDRQDVPPTAAVFQQHSHLCLETV